MEIIDVRDLVIIYMPLALLINAFGLRLVDVKLSLLGHVAVFLAGGMASFLAHRYFPLSFAPFVLYIIAVPLDWAYIKERHREISIGILLSLCLCYIGKALVLTFLVRVLGFDFDLMMESFGTRLVFNAPSIIVLVLLYQSRTLKGIITFEE